MNDTCILWFRKDLRLDDNPALIEASKHKKIIPLFIFDRNLEEYNKIGEASHWWLEKSLISLTNDLNQKLNAPSMASSESKLPQETSKKFESSGNDILGGGFGMETFNPR